MVKKAAKQPKKATVKSKKRSASASKAKPTKTAEPAVKSPPVESLTHRLDALLHTMRCIAQHEDELCSLLHNARRTGKFSAPVLRELHVVLEELPADEYTWDLNAVRLLTKVA